LTLSPPLLNDVPIVVLGVVVSDNPDRVMLARLEIDDAADIVRCCCCKCCSLDLVLTAAAGAVAVSPSLVIAEGG